MNGPPERPLPFLVGRISVHRTTHFPAACTLPFTRSMAVHNAAPREGRSEIAAGGLFMLGQIVRGMVRTSAGLVLGAVPGALYAALVGIVHLGVHGRWDRAPAFAVGCVVVGAFLGLLGGVIWALSGEPAPGTSPPPTARGWSQAPLVEPALRSGRPPVGRPVGRYSRRPGLRPGGGSRGRAPISRRRLDIGGSVQGGGCPPPIRG
jgi:hypothetical protein